MSEAGQPFEMLSMANSLEDFQFKIKSIALFVGILHLLPVTHYVYTKAS